MRMMNRSRRGAARVNLIWIIVVLIAFFSALAMVFVFDGEVTKRDELLVTARASEQAAVKNYEEEREYGRDLSKLTGYYNRDIASARAVLSSVRDDLGRFKDRFGINEASVTDFELAVPRAIAAYEARAGEITDLTQQVANLQNMLNTKTEAMNSVTAAKDSRIQELQQQLNDAEQTAANRQNELESTLAGVRASLADTESQKKRAEGETQTALRTGRDREAAFTTRLQNLSKVLEWQHEPERPDGKVLEVSEALNLAWIDIGKSNRLYGGMRFAIINGRPGNDTVKAWCEVLEVKDDMSEVLYFDQRDEFDPPVAGDVIYNPIYDPVGIRNAVLVGRFSGTYNEMELRALLDGIRINVQEKMDKTTDYLVVGAELYYDEDGEPLEDPLQPSDLAEYKEAEAMGVRIVPIKLITDYFRKRR